MTTANLGKESFYYPKIIHNNSRNKLIFYTWAFIRGNDNMSSLPSYFSFSLKSYYRDCNTRSLNRRLTIFVYTI